MPGRVRAATCLILIACPAATSAQAFECAPLQPSRDSAPAYRIIAGQARCEGFFEKTVSQPFIELVSLTRGPPPGAGVTPSPMLEIQANVQGAVRLVIQPQRSSPYYRVDAAMQGGQALAWDPAPMLAATGLPLSNLGFIALTRSNPPWAGAVAAIVPVAFTPQGQQDMRVYAVVRVSVDVASLAWRAYRLGTDASPAPTWIDMPDSHRFAWQRVTLPIELPADGKGLRIDVQAVGVSNSQSLPLLRFAVVGAKDGSP